MFLVYGTLYIYMIVVILTIIRNAYWNHKGNVRTENGNTKYIDIQRGVRQG